MTKRELAVIDAAFDVYSAWAYDAEAIGPFLPRLFRALETLDGKRAHDAFGEGYRRWMRDINYNYAPPSE
jgi:hypothetical protein